MTPVPAGAWLGAAAETAAPDRLTVVDAADFAFAAQVIDAGAFLAAPPPPAAASDGVGAGVGVGVDAGIGAGVGASAGVNTSAGTGAAVGTESGTDIGSRPGAPVMPCLLAELLLRLQPAAPPPEPDSG